jgi:hypothetical protein
VKDLTYDKKKIRIETDTEEIIVKIEPLRKEEQEAPPEVEEDVAEEGLSEETEDGKEVVEEGTEKEEVAEEKKD